jgi:NhaP-type Na+/H+ or K+/H+ antiporter
MNAIIAEESVLRGWTAGFRAGLGAATADGVFFVLAALGVVVGRLERVLRRRGYLEETSVFTITVALTFAALGAFGLAGTADVLAVFVAGLGYNWQSDPRDEAQEQKVEEVFNRVFTLPAFVLFGATLPWAAWQALGWRALAFVGGILLLRRFPTILALQRGIRPLDRPAATLFVGWFGPIGVAAIYYATLAARELGTARPWVLTSLVVAGSILAHGATAATLTLRYGRLDDRIDGW